MSKLFEYIPSGYHPKRIDYTIYVRNRKLRNVEVESKYQRSGEHYITAPDRDIAIVRNSMESGSRRFLSSRWDYAVSLALNSASGVDIQPPTLMTNYHNYMGRPAPEFCKSNPRRAKVLSDSSGFQVLMGRTAGFTDPADIGKWYKKYVDQGIIFDIPCSVHDISMELRKRASALQIESIKRLKAHSGDTQLFNVWHGFSKEDTATFAGWVDDKDLNRCSLPGYLATPSQSISKLHYLFSNVRHMKQYHLLGLYNPSFLPLLLRYLHLYNQSVPDKKKVYVSSDSTTATQFAFNSRYYTQQAHHLRMRDFAMGSNMHHSSENPSRLLPCGCLVCSALKYTDVFRRMKSSEMTATMGIHNYHTMVAYQDTIEYHARNMESGPYTAYAATQYEKSGKNESLNTLRFIDDIFSIGYDRALNRHRVALQFPTFEESQSVNSLSIFGASHKPTQKQIAVKNAIDVYEEFYSTGKIGKLHKRTGEDGRFIVKKK